MEKNLLLIKYQDNIADNLSSYAHAKIIARNNDLTCCYENTTKTRDSFEEMMSCFNLKCKFISHNRANEINKEISTRKKLLFKNNYYLNKKLFKINNISELTDDIISDLNFKNEDFIRNYDLLEEIKKLNSIGLYLGKNDELDKKYVQKATKRLNKYIKQPLLYIFSSNKFIENFDIDINYKIINLDNPKEEFYLLTSCKHKIIHCSQNSYSEAFWASVLKQKEYNYVIYDKKLKSKNKKHNWIAV